MSVTDVLEAPPAGGRRRVTKLAVAVAVVVAVGVGAAFVLFGGSAGADAEPRDGEVVELDPLTTTLGSAGLNHARVGLAVVLSEGEDPAVVVPRAPLLQDALLREIAHMDADGLRSSEGTERLRTRLSDDARSIWGEDTVRRVLLTELLVQ